MVQHTTRRRTYCTSNYGVFCKNHPFASSQEVLERTLYQRCQTYVPVVAAGRTDSGVHAVGQAVHFDLPNANEDLAQLTYSMNQMMPAVSAAKGQTSLSYVIFSGASLGVTVAYWCYTGLPLHVQSGVQHSCYSTALSCQLVQVHTAVVPSTYCVQDDFSFSGVRVVIFTGLRVLVLDQR